MVAVDTFIITQDNNDSPHWLPTSDDQARNNQNNLRVT